MAAKFSDVDKMLDVILKHWAPAYCNNKPAELKALADMFHELYCAVAETANESVKETLRRLWYATMARRYPEGYAIPEEMT